MKEGIFLPYQPVLPAERLPVGTLLAFTGGFLDAYTYLCRGNVFATAQTGNLVLLGLNAAAGDWHRVLYYFIPILAFMLGTLLAELMKNRCSERLFFEWEHAVLLLEILFLLAIGFVPNTVPHILVNTTVSFVCSLQVHTFRTVVGAPYASTMCTGNMRSAMEHLYRYLSTKERSSARMVGVYSLIVGTFCAGAAISAWLTALFGVRSVWLCCFTLLFASLQIFKGKSHS